MTPRKDRWIRLYELGLLLQKSDPRLAKFSRRALRQHAYRLVREAERFGGERYTKLWKRRLYVSVGALDQIMPIDDQVLPRVERNQAAQAQKIRAIERQQNAQGARIRNLEKWRELTARYISDVAALECAENDSKPPASSAGV